LIALKAAAVIAMRIMGYSYKASALIAALSSPLAAVGAAEATLPSLCPRALAASLSRGRLRR
jgi:hypothetical protein